MTGLPDTADAQTRRFVFNGWSPASDSGGASLPTATGDVTYDPRVGHGLEPPEGDPSSGHLTFSVALPEGDYRVALGMAAPGDRVVVRAEARRLMLTHAADGQTFVVNVRRPELAPPPQNAPGARSVRLNDRETGSRSWDDRLTLEFTGDASSLRSLTIEAVTVPRIILLGDSTVADQPSEPTTSWGQILPLFLKSGVSVANHAESGETLKSFLAASRLDKALSQTRPGDVVMIQFGHNDSKAQWPQTYAEAHTTYPAYLHVFIAEIRLRGAIPVLLTSPQRRTFDAEGLIANSHGDYPEAVRRVGRETGTPVIDLSVLSTQFYQALGPQPSVRAFANAQDGTHHSAYGAWVLARAIAEALRDLPTPMAEMVVDDLPAFDVDAPPSPEVFDLPPSASVSALRPRGS